MAKDDISLFGTENEISEETVNTGSKLDLIKFKALKVDSVEKWQDLFAGFTELKAVTFSSSLGMIKWFCKNFQKLEIIFGNENVAGDKMRLLEEQYGLVSTLHKENAKSGNVITEKMSKGELNLLVTKLDGVTSHQKIYLLSNPEENNYRVITGSANMTFTAFGGQQLEIINVADDYESYVCYEDIYENTKELSTREVTVEQVLDLDLNHLEKMPLFSEVQERKIVTVVKDVVDDDAAATYIVQKDAFKKALDEAGIKEEDVFKKQGRNKLLSVQNLVELRRKISVQADVIKRRYEQFPAFCYLADENIMQLNGEPLDLTNIADEDVVTDIELLKKFFNGYFDEELPFTGNVIAGVEKYFATIVYAFAAPFISVCRYHYVQHTDDPFAFPMFLLLRGNSNAGKTQLLKFILRLMFNPYHININNANGVFQSATAEENAPNGLLNKVVQAQGFPVMLDELSKGRWKDYEDKVVKRDIVSMEKVSPVLMASNEVSPLGEALIKRTIVFDVNMNVPRRDIRLVRSNIKETKKLTGALYRKFLQKMLLKMPDFMEKFKSEERYAPDLFKLSSETLADIFAQYGDVPNYVKIYGLDYYTEKVNVAENREKLLKMYVNEGDTWEVNRKKNKLVIPFDASYKADYFQREYKEDCGIEYFGGMTVTLDLAKTEKFLGRKIQGASWISKVFGKD